MTNMRLKIGWKKMLQIFIFIIERLLSSISGVSVSDGYCLLTHLCLSLYWLWKVIAWYIIFCPHNPAQDEINQTRGYRSKYWENKNKFEPCILHSWINERVDFNVDIVKKTIDIFLCLTTFREVLFILQPNTVIDPRYWNLIWGLAGSIWSKINIQLN